MPYNAFMDLKEILDFFKENLQKLAISAFFGILLGGIIFAFLPIKYLSSGTLFVGRKVSDSKDFYSYSGYYDQLTALSFSDTIKGLLEDKNLLSQVLPVLEQENTEKNIRKLRRQIRTKDAGPQLIGLEVKSNTPEEAEKIWLNLFKKVVEATQDINKKSDPSLFIQITNDKIWTRKSAKNPLILCLAGGLITIMVETFFLATKEYLKKWENPKKGINKS